MTEARVEKIIDVQRQFFLSGQTKSVEFRLQQLKKLETLISENTDAILAALHQDLRKPAMEAFTTEVLVLLEEVRYLRKHLKKWAAPQRVSTPLILQPARSEIHPEPLGVVLILSPWNYPFQLALAPLMGALAAGNCAILKPSELAAATAQLLQKLIPEYFPFELVSVVEGGITETTAILKQRFDHIFFTGSTAVGKVVMRAAAEHLTPVTLELGGKSPAIVTPSADLKLAARRVAWGKFLNAGQTCVAPDYVLVHETVANDFSKALKEQITVFYGQDPQQSDSYARILNTRNFERLENMLDEKLISAGGRRDKADLYIEPTLLEDVQWDDAVMREEIFGPLLPLITYAELEPTLAEIALREKPLAAYLFSDSAAESDLFLQKLSFGGGCVNDVIMHLSSPQLPFGGVGASGLGAYHGKKSFEIFSHHKSVVKKSRFLDFAFRYPPYLGRHLQRLRAFFKA